MQVGPDWETLIERQIREAQEDGKFQDLPYHGEPLPNDANPYAGDMGLAFHMLKNAGVVPPWIQADKDVRELMGKRDAILARAASGPAPTDLERRRDRAAIQDLVLDANAAITRLNSAAPTDRQHRRLLSAAAELTRYDEAARRD
jgi:hypothetical protein